MPVGHDFVAYRVQSDQWYTRRAFRREIILHLIQRDCIGREACHPGVQRHIILTTPNRRA